METWKVILALLSFAGIPSAVTAIVFSKIMKRMESRDKCMFLLMKMSMAGVELGEATAISYVNKRCNGEISLALDKAQKIRSEYTDFLTKQCVDSIQ